MDKNTGYGETPPRLKRRINRGPAKGTKLDFSLEEGRDYTKKQKKDIKPIEEGDMGPPSTVTPGDFKEVARMMGSPVQNELAELGKGRKLINQVEGMPGIQSQSDAQMQKIIVEGKKPSETEGGGILEMFGLAGGRKRKSKRTKRMARKSRRKSRRNQRGGRGRTITYANLDFMANNRLGKMVPHGDAYTNCNTQTGGGGYGFTKEGASASETFKGGYPVFTKYEKSNQCGGKRRRRRKSRKSRKSKRKSRRKSRKSRRKRRKSRRRRRRRRKAGSPDPDEGRLFQRGGSSHTYGSPVAVGSKPWATAPLGIQANKPSCYDNYNHYKGL